MANNLLNLVYDPRFPDLKFVILEQPKPGQDQHILQELNKHNVTHCTRVCAEFEYDYTSKFHEQGIECHALPFDDGSHPPASVIQEWSQLCDTVIATNSKCTSKVDDVGTGRTAIAIHCVAGLGRAPVMVALMYIECGMSSIDAVALLKDRRRGSLNNKQINFLRNYKRQKKAGGCCTIL